MEKDEQGTSKSNNNEQESTNAQSDIEALKHNREEASESKLKKSNEDESIAPPSNTELPAEAPEPRFMQRSPPHKANDYDFTAARAFVNGPNTVCESIAHMIKVVLVGGVFAMHVAFSRVGITTGIIGLAFLAAMIGCSMCSLVSSAQKMYGRIHVSRMSYPDLVEATLLLSPWRILRKHSKCFRCTMEFILMFHLLCTCGIFQIIIARGLKQMIDEDIEDIHANYFKNQNIYVMAITPLCMLVVMIRQLKHLAPFAVVIDLYANMAALVTIYYSMHTDVKIDTMPTISTNEDLCQFIGICLFSLRGINVALVIENNMANPKSFRYVVLGSLPYATCIMMIIGVFGYWAFGDRVIAPITVHFPWNHFPVLAKMFLCIVVYITYAEVFYFGFDIQWSYLKLLYEIPRRKFWEKFYRILNVIIISVLTFLFPNVCKLMGFLGCFSASILCLIIPAFIELIVDWKYPGLGSFSWRLLKFLAISYIGITICIAGTYYSL